MEKQRSMKQHVSFVGALHVGFGILGLLGALAVYLSFHFAYSFVETEPIAEKLLSFLPPVRRDSRFHLTSRER